MSSVFLYCILEVCSQRGAIPIHVYLYPVIFNETATLMFHYLVKAPEHDACFLCNTGYIQCVGKN